MYKGIRVEQIEAEFYARMAELVEQCVEAELADRVTLVTYYSIYLVEVVKRWQTPGITPQKVIEKSMEAMERRVRKMYRDQGVKELKELLEEEPNEHGPRDEGDTRQASRPRDEKDKGPRDSNTRTQTRNEATRGREGGGPRDAQDQPRPIQGSAAEIEPTVPVEKSPGPPVGSDDDSEEAEPMTQKSCPKCFAPLGPEISNPKDPDSTLPTVRSCPGCGWNPGDLTGKPPVLGKKPRRKPQTGPQPERAGKRFSGG